MPTLAQKKANPRSTYWRNKADKEITRLFRGAPCIICGTTQNTCGHHLVSKARSATTTDRRKELMMKVTEAALKRRDKTIKTLSGQVDALRAERNSLKSEIRKLGAEVSRLSKELKNNNQKGGK